MNYDDIIHLEYEPKNHRRMSRENRAAQFAPFSALEGYKQAIIETGRETVIKKDLTDEEIAIINQKINWLETSHDKVSITYFEKDKKKKGGSYQLEEGMVSKIDKYHQVLVINNQRISFFNIIDIDIKK